MTMKSTGRSLEILLALSFLPFGFHRRLSAFIGGFKLFLARVARVNEMKSGDRLLPARELRSANDILVSVASTAGRISAAQSAGFGNRFGCPIVRRKALRFSALRNVAGNLL